MRLKEEQQDESGTSTWSHLLEDRAPGGPAVSVCGEGGGGGGGRDGTQTLRHRPLTPGQHPGSGGEALHKTFCQ